MTRESYLRCLIQENYTLKDFANKIGMPYSTLLSILRNVGGGSFDNVRKICAGLNIPLDTLDSIEGKKIDCKLSPACISKDDRELLQGLLNTFFEKTTDILNKADNPNINR